MTGTAAPVLYEKFASRLAELADSAKAQGSKVLEIMIPDVVQLYHPELQEVNRIVEKTARKSSVDYLDVTPFFEKEGHVKGLYLLPHDAHISPNGHRIIAEEVEKKVRRMVHGQ